MGHYSQAAICPDGHVYNAYGRIDAHRCPDCGKELLTACPACNIAIRGEYNVPGVVAIGFAYEPPAYCYNCGEPFPWTAAALASALELARELEGLKAGDRELLERSLADIIHDSPRTELAAIRIKKILASAKGPAVKAMMDLILKIAAEGARVYLMA